MNFFSKISTFLKEARLEMKKVNWPTKQETLRYTLIVIGVSVATAVFLGTCDFIFKTFLTKFILSEIPSIEFQIVYNMPKVYFIL